MLRVVSHTMEEHRESPLCCIMLICIYGCRGLRLFSIRCVIFVINVDVLNTGRVGWVCMADGCAWAVFVRYRQILVPTMNEWDPPTKHNTVKYVSWRLKCLNTSWGLLTWGIAYHLLEGRRSQLSQICHWCLMNVKFVKSNLSLRRRAGDNFDSVDSAVHQASVTNLTQWEFWLNRGDVRTDVRTYGRHI